MRNGGQAVTQQIRHFSDRDWDGFQELYERSFPGRPFIYVGLENDGFVLLLEDEKTSLDWLEEQVRIVRGTRQGANPGPTVLPPPGNGSEPYVYREGVAR